MKLRVDKFKIFWMLILCVHVFLAVMFGMQKEGFHEDEYFTYWSSAGTSASDITPSGGRSWTCGYDLQRKFLVQSENRFDFAQVIQNQVEDVHPPLHYLLLNVLMSLRPERFYKWFGIGLNLIFSLITCSGIIFLFSRLEKTRFPIAALLAGTAYAIAPSTISNIMLNRMYALSAMWTILYACIFIVLMQNQNCSRKKLAFITVGGMAVCYFSFLTHYFCLLVSFFLTLGYCLYVLIKRKGILRMIIFGGAMLAAIGLAVLTFPACLDHIFNGYRGAGAINGLQNLSLSFTIGHFTPYINKNIFGGCLYFVLVIVLLGLFIGLYRLYEHRKSRTGQEGITQYCLWTIFLGCILSYCVLTKTALLVGDSSNRYFYPVAALMVPLTAFAVMQLVPTSGNVARNKKTITCIICAVLALSPYIAGHMQNRVLFLFREEKAKIEFANENKEIPLVVVYSRDKSYLSWFTVDQFWPYEQICFIDQEHALQKLEDEILLSADKLILYMDAPEEVLTNFINENPNLSTYTLVRHDPFYYVYLLE